MKSGVFVFLSILTLISGFSISDAYADTDVTLLQEISNSTLTVIGDSDLFGYDVENIGDLDGNGEDDFATINFHDFIVLDRDGDTDPVGSISIIFMNSDGSASGVKKISIDNSTIVNDGMTGEYTAVISDFKTGNGIGQNFDAVLGSGCLSDITHGPSNTWYRETKAIEEIAYLGVRDIVGGNAGAHAVLALGTSAYDYNGEDSGGVTLIEIDTDGTVLSCNILGENGDISFTNPSTAGVSRGAEWTYFGWPLIATDVDGDDTLDLVVGQDDDYDGGYDANGLPTNFDYLTNPQYFHEWYGNRTAGIVLDNNTPKSGDSDTSPNSVRKCIADGIDFDYRGTDLGQLCQPEMWIGTTDLVVLLLNDNGSVKGTKLIDAGAFGMDGSIRWLETGSTIDGNGKIAVSGNACNKYQSSAVYILDLDTDGTLLSSFEYGAEYIDDNFPGFNLNLDADNYGDCASAFGSGLAPLTDLDNNGVDDLLIGNEQNGEVGAYVTYLESNGSIKDMNKIESPTNKSVNFAHGNAFWKVNGTEVLMLIGAHEYPNDNYGGAVFVYSLEYSSSGTAIGGNSENRCDDCIDPTFYYSQHKIIVENGFRYNDFSTDVTDRVTEIPLIETKINQQNKLILKVYDNRGTDNIKWIDVGFGIPKNYDNLDKAEVTLEIKFKNNNVIETKIHDPLNLIDFDVVESEVVNCGYIDEECLQVTIPHSFRDQLLNMKLLISTTDYEPNEKNHTISEGIHIQGNSIDPPPTHKLFIKKYLGTANSEWVVITLIDRPNGIWASEDGLEFISTHGGGFKRITLLGPDPNSE